MYDAETSKKPPFYSSSNSDKCLSTDLTWTMKLVQKVNITEIEFLCRLGILISCSNNNLSFFLQLYLTRGWLYIQLSVGCVDSSSYINTLRQWRPSKTPMQPQYSGTSFFCSVSNKSKWLKWLAWSVIGPQLTC